MTFQLYLSRQIALAIGGVLSVGLMLICTSRLLQYTESALNGKLEMWVALTAVGLRIPEFMLAFLPLSVAFGTYLALSRLWAQNEITAAHYAGISSGRIERPVLLLALLGALATAALSLWVVPAASERAVHLLEESKARSSLIFLDTGYFHPMSRGWHMYLRDRSEGSLLGQMTVRRDGDGAAQLAWAEQMDIADCALLEPCSLHISWPQGIGYASTTGDGKLIAKSNMAQMELPYNDHLWTPGHSPTGLLASADGHTRLQWHLAGSLYLLVVTLLMLPLARVSPRQARFRWLPAVILLTLLYLALTLAGRQSLGAGRLDATPGLWPLHGGFLALALMIGPFGGRILRLARRLSAGRGGLKGQSS